MMKTEHRSSKRFATWKKILLVLLAVILALAIVTVFTYSRYLHPTGEIMSGVYAVRNDRNGTPMVNFFIMQAGDNYIAFDTGSDMEQTQNALYQLGISASDIVAVFLTHSDWDHVGSLHLFYNATIYSWDSGFPYANATAFATSVFEPPNFPHHALSDGEILEIYGRSIQSIFTPGHTSDSVSFIVDGRYLFVGDLFVNPRLARYNEELQRYHMTNILEMESVEYVFTGHFGLFRSIGFFRWWYGD